MSSGRESTAVARQTVGRRVAPNEKGFVYQAGYNKVLGYYSAGFRAFRFSGSSYNRKFQKDYNESKEKDIHRRAEIVTAMDKEKGRCTAEEQSGYEREIFEIRVSIENECSNKGNTEKSGNGFSCSLCGVSRLFTATVVSPSCFAQACTAKNFSVNKNTGECFYPKVIKKQYWLMVYIHNKRFPLEYLAELEQLNKWLLSGEFEFHSWRDMPVVDEEQYRKYFICKN